MTVYITSYDRAGSRCERETESDDRAVAHGIAADLMLDHGAMGVVVSRDGDEATFELTDAVSLGSIRGGILRMEARARRHGQCRTWAVVDFADAKESIREALRNNDGADGVLEPTWRQIARDELAQALYWRDAANKFCSSDARDMSSTPEAAADESEGA